MADHTTAIRDLRTAAWCWQEKAALRLLRDHYAGQRRGQRSTALAVYLALTEAASNQYSQGQAAVMQRAIADAIGGSRSTVKRYLTDFEAIGLIAVERRKLDSGTSLPNVYALLTPPSTDERYPSTATNAPPSTSERQPTADGPQQEEPPLSKDEEKNGSSPSLNPVSRLTGAVRSHGLGLH